MKTATSNQDNPADDYFGRDLEAMSFAVNYHRWIARMCQPWVGRSIIEVGAGSGNFTEVLLEAYKPEVISAMEPSANMYPLLERHYRGHASVRPCQGCLEDWARTSPPKADSAFYVNVLEHIQDDAAELKLAHAALKDDGHLFIFVPALPWLFGTADRNFGHFRRYTKKSLLQVADAAGFEPVRCRYVDVAGILPWWLSFVVMRTETLKPGMVRLYDRVVVPVMSRVERLIPPPVGKNLLLVARKKTAASAP